MEDVAGRCGLVVVGGVTGGRGEEKREEQLDVTLAPSLRTYRVGRSMHEYMDTHAAGLQSVAENAGEFVRKLCPPHYHLDP